MQANTNTQKPILVLGATGKQGRKLISTLLASPTSSSFLILALTRNPESPSAKSLAAKSSTIKLIKGNLDDVPAIFASALAATHSASIWGVFGSLQAVQDGATQARETKQGKDLIDSAIASGVKVLVYSSVDRGGDEKSDTNPTHVPPFISKFDIEMHLKERCKTGIGRDMQWTILRPVFFMDNFTPDFMGKVMATMVKVGVSPHKKLAFVATSDIGFFAAQAFMNPDNPDYNRKAISLAGDELNFGQVDRLYKEKLGYGVPVTFGFLARFMKWMVSEYNMMFQWFDKEGYGADFGKLKKMHPGLLDLGTWLERESGFPVKK